MIDRKPTATLLPRESLPFAPLEIKRPKHERIWLPLVVLLSLPAVVFILLRQLFIGFPHLNAEWPEALGIMLSWTLAFTGTLGWAFTLNASVVAVVANFVARLSWKVKFAMWLCVVASLVACVYGGVVP
jgi:hypothetical protein